MSHADDKKKFSAIIASLPSDKKTELYNKLIKLSESDREKAIHDIVTRYENSNKKPEPVQKKAAAHNPYPAKPIASTNLHKPANKTSTAKSKAKSLNPDKNTRNTTKKNKKSKLFITLLIVDIILVIAVLVVVMSRYGKKNTKETELVAETSAATEVVETTEETTPIPTATPTPSPTPTPIPDGNEGVDLTGLIIVLDAGHQEATSEELESCASWLGSEKPRCTSGTVGVTSGVYEYDLTLRYAKMIGTYLEQKGATVIYTRTENAVDVSNQERAQIANDNAADVFIRIHADAANDSMASGVRVYIPDTGDYTSSSVTRANRLGTLVAEAEGMELNAVKQTNQYTGLNYANKIVSFQISLGFLSNSDDEAILLSEDNMVNVAYAMAQFCYELK